MHASARPVSIHSSDNFIITDAGIPETHQHRSGGKTVPGGTNFLISIQNEDVSSAFRSAASGTGIEIFSQTMIISPAIL